MLGQLKWNWLRLTNLIAIIVEEQLRELINQLRQCDYSSLERQKLLNRLLSLISKLPGIYRSSHQDYPEAYNRTLEWVAKNIEHFEARSSYSIIQSFVVWINGYLRWRILDLYTAEQNYKSKRVYEFPESQSDRLSQMSDPKYSLNLLDRKIAQLQELQRQRQGNRVKDYIEADPDEKLRNCHPKKCSACHCQFLAKKLLLTEPPAKISEIAREFDTNNQTLYSHWKQKCLPLLREIIGTQTHDKP